MAKTSKKALGAAMAGVMAVAGIAGAVNQVQVASAAESQALKDVNAKISHLSWSVKNNYLGIKNQGQWEAYIKEAKALIAKMPSAEKAIADSLTETVNKIDALVKAVARINQVEKSIETNFNGIKNAKQWNEYLELAKTDLAKVDQATFADQIANIAERSNKCADTVKKIEDAFKVELAAAEKLYDAARSSMNLDDAKKALVEAEKLGTCTESDTLEAKVKGLIAQIEKLDVEVKSVSVDSKTYDDDAENQRLSIKVNGESINIDFLKGAGYDVKFTEIDGASTSTLLAADGATTGKLLPTPTVGDYKVQVTVSKAGNVVVSDVANIKVANLDNAATTISSTLFENSTIVGSTITPLFNQTSSNVVVGENLVLKNIKVTNGTETTKVADTNLGKVTIKSSDETVLAVDNVKHTVKAVGLGTAKITVSYGTITKEISYTTVGTARKIAKVTSDTSSVNVRTNGNGSIKIKTVDQYGDPFIATQYDTESTDAQIATEVKIEATGKLTLATLVATDDDEDANNAVNKITFTAGDKEETAVIYVKDNNGNSLGQFSVKTVKDTGVLSTKLEVVKTTGDQYSDDTKLMINTDSAKTEDSIVKLALNEYTTAGVKKDKAEFGGSTVTFDSKLITVKAGATPVESGTPILSSVHDKELEIGIKSANKTGSTTLSVVKNGVKFEVTITVFAEDDIKISAVNWTNVSANAGITLKASDVLKLKSTSADSIVESVTLSASSLHSVRIVDDSDATNYAANKGTIYIDKDDNGSLTAGDVKVGELQLAGTESFTSTDAIAGQTIVSGNKGSIVFSVVVKDEDGAFKKVLSTKGFNLQ